MGSGQQDAAAVGGAAAVSATWAAGRRRISLRLEFISDRQTRAVLAAMRLASAAAWALLLWELVVQSQEDSNSLLRTHRLEWVNIGVGSFCLPVMLSTCAWYGRRVWAAARSVRLGGAQPMAPRKRYLLGLTCAELALHTLNLCCYLSMNIYSIKVPCSWFNVPVDALTLVSFTVWNTLFCLNISRPLVLLPRGSWFRIRERWAARGSICRWLATACCSTGCCCYCCCDATWCGGGAARPAGPGAGKQGEAEAVADPEQPPQPLALDRSFSLDPVTKDDQRMAVWVHATMLLAIWLPTEALIFISALGSMGFMHGSDNIAVCARPDGSANPGDCIPANALPTPADYQGCESLDWNCNSAPVYTALSIAVGGMFTAALVLFVVLMGFVLAEYRKLPYTPFRVLNVAARLQLRTRMFATLFFLVSIILVFYLNVNSCNANLELWLGLGPMMIKMSILLVVEAYLYSPSMPHDRALKLHTTLQQFAWVEAAAPAVQQQRGLPGEPLFCFESALKTCYFALHSYRHFRPESTISSLQSAMALYGCTHHEWLREPTHDMNCLLAWGPRALVITFRGTQSLANIRADAQFWRSPHPPRRGVFLLGTQPMVHTGFLASWVGRGLDRQVLQRVRQVLEGRHHGSDMPPFDTTVVRCCSQAHEEKGAALAAAAAAALEAEAAAAGGGMSGYGESQELSGLDEAAVAAVLAELAGQGSATSQASLASNGSAGNGSSSSSAGGGLSGGGASLKQQQQQQPFRIIVTGHSLGGAVATLCAADLARELPKWGFAPLASPEAPSSSAAQPRAAEDGAPGVAGIAANGAAGAAPAAAAAPAGTTGPAGAAAAAAAAAAAEAGGIEAAQAAAAAQPVWLSVYTFGAPRTGNHAFAREYGQLVPDSWSVINDQDLVAKSAKFLVLFKRPGNVVIVNPQGDLIVNPSFLEHNVQRSFSSSVKQHLLLSYNQSFAAVLRAQHAGKRLSGGPQATALLAACPAVRELLVKPLAIRHASLKRFIFASGASYTASTTGAAGAARAARPSPFEVPSEQVLVSDLSGDVLQAAAEALEAAGQTQQAASLREAPQSAPSALAKGVLSDTLETFMF
ncbi:hypothetical protein ABPG75_013515 [Micractinium tetrahymenae]